MSLKTSLVYGVADMPVRAMASVKTFSRNVSPAWFSVWTFSQSSTSTRGVSPPQLMAKKTIEVVRGAREPKASSEPAAMGCLRSELSSHRAHDDVSRSCHPSVGSSVDGPGAFIDSVASRWLKE